MAEIIKELTTIQKTSDISSEQLLEWAKRVKAQRAQRAILTNIQENKKFDTIRCMRQNSENMCDSQTMKRKCQSCGTADKLRRFPSLGKKCTRCGKSNHFQMVCKTPN